MWQRYFKGKRIWMTGASSGIGKALALQLLQCDVRALIVSGRDVSRMNDLASPVTLVQPFDVTDPAAYPKVSQAIQNFCGGLDIVLFNAGGSEHFSSDAFHSAPILNQMVLNYDSVIYGIEAALPLLRKSSTPHLIGMSSVAGFFGLPGAAAYCAAKAAVRIFLEGLRCELYAEKIPVSIICPGFVSTPLTAKNKFYMPFLMSAERAALIIAKGIARQQVMITFPKRMQWLIYLLRVLPLRWYAKRLSARG